MARRRGAAPSRPAAPSRAPPAPQRQQTRPMSTAAAAPPGQQAQQKAGSSGPGLMGQMASTAAGVAIGSSIGHAIGGFFGGGSSAQAAEGTNTAAASYDQGTTANANSMAQGGMCAKDLTNFRSCLDQNDGNMTICSWYLEKLKACQQAASPY